LCNNGQRYADNSTHISSKLSQYQSINQASNLLSNVKTAQYDTSLKINFKNIKCYTDIKEIKYALTSSEARKHKTGKIIKITQFND